MKKGQATKKAGERRGLMVPPTSNSANEGSKLRSLQPNHFSQQVGFRVGFGSQTPILEEETTDIYLLV